MHAFNSFSTFNRFTVFSFGKYKGYELGIIYMCDPGYIEWCINNMDDFFVEDLDILMNIGVLNPNLSWQYRAIGEASIVPGIDTFDTFQEYLDNFGEINLPKFKFNEITIKKNDQNRGLA